MAGWNPFAKPQSQDFSLGGADPNAQQYQMPAVPWGQNDAVTAAAFGLISGDTFRQGMKNAAQMIPAGLASNTAKRRDMYTIQQQNAQRAQMNEALKNWPGLTPEQKAIFTNQPELFGQYAVSTMTPKEQWRSLTDPAQRLAAGIPAEDKRPAQIDLVSGEVKFPGGGGTNITSIGSVPQDYRLVTHPDGSLTQEVIPGSKTDLEQKAAAAQTTSREETKQAKLDTVVDAVDRTVAEVVANPTATTGLAGWALGGSPVPVPASRVASLIRTLEANTSIQNMQTMREQNKTGAALGNASDKDLEIMKQLFGDLRQSNDPETFLYNVKRIKNTWLDLTWGAGNGPPREEITVPPPMGQKPDRAPVDPDNLQPGAQVRNPTTNQIHTLQPDGTWNPPLAMPGG